MGHDTAIERLKGPVCGPSTLVTRSVAGTADGAA
ncbi:MAG: hypothetical protein JWN52_6271 [Actinomycetia bacterium]|nr:hypothetical protein [Actinomycetes bacterium]